MGSLTLPRINHKLLIVSFQVIFVVHYTHPGIGVY